MCPNILKKGENIMEEKLVQLLKLVDILNKQQDELYAQIEYCANNTKKLEISIRRKQDYSYVEKCSVMLLSNSISKLDAIISIFEKYIGGCNE